MRIWQKLFKTPNVLNCDKNQIANIENDCSCKTNEQLLQSLQCAHNQSMVKGIQRVLMSRGFSRKELENLQQHTIH